MEAEDIERYLAELGTELTNRELKKGYVAKMPLRW